MILWIILREAITEQQFNERFYDCILLYTLNHLSVLLLLLYKCTETHILGNNSETFED